MLNITDLIESKEMGTKEMSSVRGGFDPFSFLATTTSINKVADVSQAFDFALAQGNTGEVINNQAFAGGNGVTTAPVYQTQDQYNDLFITDIGNISVK